MSKAAELAALIGSQTALSNRNLIINGAMQVAQRGTSSTGAGRNASSYWNIDRFKAENHKSYSGTFYMLHKLLLLMLPQDLLTALKLDCTTADTVNSV